MGARTNKTIEAIRDKEPFREGENYVGGFLGRTKIRWGWYFLIGPLAALTMKQYQVVVTNQRVLFGRMSLFGGLTQIDHFVYNDIQRVIMNKAYFPHPFFAI